MIIKKTSPKAVGSSDLVELCTEYLTSPKYDPDSPVRWEHPDLDVKEDVLLKMREYSCPHCMKVWRVPHSYLEPIPAFGLDAFISHIPPTYDLMNDLKKPDKAGEWKKLKYVLGTPTSGTNSYLQAIQAAKLLNVYHEAWSLPEE